MAVEVPLRLERAVALRLAPDAAFALRSGLARLADVPAWGALFPHVERVEPYAPAGPDAFLWTMAPLGPPGVGVRVAYACRYHAHAAALTVAWTPVEDVGNARFAGDVALRLGEGGGTVGTLILRATLWIPAPALVRPAVVPAVTFEFGRMVDVFTARLAALR